MENVAVHLVETEADYAVLDNLLWQVLWAPLGLPRDVRSRFKVDGKLVQLLAMEGPYPVGGAVAIWKNINDAELRHLAVIPANQGRGVGKELVLKMINELKRRGCRELHTYARDSSVAFFKKLGFNPATERLLDHEAYIKYGIAVRLMNKQLSINCNS